MTQPLAFVVVFGLILLMAVWGVVRVLWPRVSDAVDTAESALYLLTGTTGVGHEPLLSMVDEPQRLRIDRAQPLVQATDGNPLEAIDERGRLVQIGDYFYRLVVRRGHLRWSLEGVRLRVGDEIGRAPAFHHTGYLAYQPTRLLPTPGSSRGRMLSFWADGFPSTAFVALGPERCTEPGRVACLEITGGADRITLQTSGGIRRVLPGDVVGMAAADILWIAHLPFQLRGVDGDARAFDLWLTERYLSLHGTRAQLGEMVFHGSLPLRGNSRTIAVHDVSLLFRHGKVVDYVWNPETEDGYQVLIDAGLLCLELQPAGTDVAPQLVWKDPARPGCDDPLGRALGKPAAPRDAALSEAVIGLFRHRRRDDQLVRRTNELLKAGLFRTSPGSLPFAFEWWPVRMGPSVIPLPTALWGTQTLSTWKPREARRVENRAGNRLLVLVAGDGTRSVLAQTIGPTRVYARGEDLLGLGPVLGVRGLIDGLDLESLVERVDEGRGDQVALTIHPELQRNLWSTLKRDRLLASKRAQIAASRHEARAHGVSAVALDAASGDVLAVLNWPQALDFDDPAEFELLLARPAVAVVEPSRNTAMLRMEATGSVFKMLTLYTMADLGILDGANLGRFTATGAPINDGKPFGVLRTGAGLNVFPDGGIIKNSHSVAPLPVGRRAIANGVVEATGVSCNTFFGLAATMVLGREVPDVVYVEPRCPIDEKLQRTDGAHATARQWVLCRASPTVDKKLHGEGATWLLLPQDENLLRRATAGLKSASDLTGYFGRAIDAGFSFNYLVDAKGHWKGGRSETAYEAASFRRDWFPDVPVLQATSRVFTYPEIWSPGSGLAYGDGRASHQERFTSRDVTVHSGTWHDFYGYQAIGMSGRASALAMAVLYSAVGRTDGLFATPHLIRTGATVAPTHRAFHYTPARLQVLRTALAAPLSFGTARHLSTLAKGGGVIGKTGTFAFLGSHLLDDDPAGLDEECGVPAWRNGLLLGLGSPAWSRSLGSEGCERRRLAVTGIHRYPDVLPASPELKRVLDRRADFTSFVAVVFGPERDGRRRAIVLAMQSDVKDAAAKHMIAPLILATKDWLDRNPETLP